MLPEFIQTPATDKPYSDNLAPLDLFLANQSTQIVGGIAATFDRVAYAYPVICHLHIILLCLVSFYTVLLCRAIYLFVNVLRIKPQVLVSGAAKLCVIGSCASRRRVNGMRIAPVLLIIIRLL